LEPVVLGKVFGLQFRAERSVFVAWLLLWIVLAFLAMGLFNIPFPQTLLDALIMLGLHAISGLTHQMGHAWMARRVGHPMIGLRFWAVIAASEYPADEPPLPGRIHIQRALGGPIFSAGLSLIAVIGLILTAPYSIAIRVLAGWFFFENLFVFTLGALLPLGFSDGSTLLRWWGKP
jgi:hypothetical protein